MDQDEIIKEQDEQLNEIESSVKRIKQNAQLINRTIVRKKYRIKKLDKINMKIMRKMKCLKS